MKEAEETEKTEKAEVGGAHQAGGWSLLVESPGCTTISAMCMCTVYLG